MVLKNHKDTKMWEVVLELLEGRNGNGETYEVNHPLHKLTVDCGKQLKSSLEITGTKFVQLCPEISGSMGSLDIDDEYVDEECSIPIDTLVVHMTNGATAAEN